MKSKKNQNKARRGNLTLITAAISVLLVGILALVTDVGSLYYDHARLQTATNAAWKAGYDKLLEIRKTKANLTEEDETAIKNHMKEVLAANGFADLNDEQLKILFTNNHTNLKIDTNDEAQLFFMKIFDVQSAKVAASRAGGSQSFSILPIAIPHGEVHDISEKTYEYLPFNEGEGFATGTEYILKLGELGNTDPIGDEEYMIYIPTGLGGSQSSDSKTMLAYGAIFWALQIDERDVLESLTPAYWLLSNNGGGFLMRANKNFEQKLNSGDYAGVYYEKANADRIRNLLSYVGVYIDVTEINDYLTGLTNGTTSNSLIVPLIKRPQIAIYSSQTDLDPVEQILIAAKIPYGNYALPKTAINPNGWDRTTNYDSSKNTKVFDLDILKGELDKYDWIHLHHEDFTGLTTNDGSSYCNAKFPTDCSNLQYKTTYNYTNCCYNKIKLNSSAQYDYSYGSWIKQTKTSVNPFKKWHDNNITDAMNKFKAKLCATCLANAVLGYAVTYDGHFKSEWDGTAYVNGMKVGVCVQKWKKSADAMRTSCKKTTSTTTLVGRCGSCGNCDPNNLGNQANFKGCKYYNYIKNTYGYTDDALEYYVFTKSDLSLSMADLCSKWFGKATAYQKMKWAVSEKIKEHILKGGFMYTQCFAAETLDLSLQQGAYYKTKNLTDSYKNCIAFENFTYKKVPAKTGYSSIDYTYGGNCTVQNDFKESAFCQVSGTPSVGTGATSAFNNSVIKSFIDKMAQGTTNVWKYLGGVLTNSAGEAKGHFSLLGGHSASNINGKRLVLNNILYGSTANKETSIGTHYAGRTKYQYGCVDLNNDGDRNSDDYSKWMLYGYEAPVNYADIVSTDNKKYTSETINNIDTITGKVELENYTPNQIVIVPIVGVPDSVKNYQKTVTNERDAKIENDDYTIYDLKVNDTKTGAVGYDNLDSRFSPSQLDTTSLKNSVQIIGFAKFRIKSEDEYNRTDVLGNAMFGQVRGEFLEYIIDPRETAELLEQYNAGY